MRYSKAHKQRTHKHILDAATRAFRAEGVTSVAIPTIMRQVGLTHGGFYAHFPSKDALVAEACAQGSKEMADQLFATAAAAPPGEGLNVIINFYLSRSHRDTPETGCTIPTLAAEIAREPEAVRHAFTQSLRNNLLARIAPFLPERFGDSASAREDAALVLLSGMAGALLVARAVDDPALSDHILKQSRAFYRSAFAPGPDEPINSSPALSNSDASAIAK